MTMASVHKDPRGKSKHWFAAFRDADGHRRFRSTHSEDRKQAEEIARAWEHGAKLKKNGKLDPDAARNVINEGLSRIFADKGGSLPSCTVEGFCKKWLTSKKREVAPTSFQRYEGVVKHFLDFLGKDKDHDISTMTTVEITRFRDNQAERLSPSSAHLALKVLRGIFGDAQRQRLVSQNIAGLVRQIKMRGESQRRAFTIAEIKRVLEKAKGSEWQGLVLLGIYTGQRLGDLARLTWRQVDLDKKEVSLTTRKTGRRSIIPLAKPLESYLVALPSSDHLDTPLFPKSFEKVKKRTATLSNEFFELLVDAGLAEKRSNEATGKGRNAPRPVSPLTFHSLRHSATTFLKAAGVSDALARELIGHESAEVNRHYTHLGTADMRKAIKKLPDVTKEK